jgi:hypothetical protein
VLPPLTSVTLYPGSDFSFTLKMDFGKYLREYGLHHRRK